MTKPQPRDFPGRGVLLCAACNDPLSEHPIQPCKFLGVRVIYTDAPHSGRLACGTEAAIRHHHRRNDPPCMACRDVREVDDGWT